MRRPDDADRQPGVPLPVTRLRGGESGVVAALGLPDGQKLQKIMAMGIFPGQRLRVVQRFPAYVFQVGYTQVAVDEEIAAAILVYPDGTGDTAGDGWRCV